MASNFVIKEESYDNHHSHHQAPSPRGVVRRSFSSNSSSCGPGVAGGAAPKCVCAPATHAGSFKCRLHRTNSQGHSPRSPTTIPSPRPSGATPASTVEAQ
ncbi:hypothetical protein ZIOFF_061541 [Zingiber officinale]|uniref:Uncharacterized protein n=1 Tax=Zingiber officinale TaxID=94328 RepID=A0A8J5KEP2_ZINOF|nr:hypothetical protein ZIOFF_061541 [Zingiber officinale]